MSSNAVVAAATAADAVSVAANDGSVPTPAKARKQPPLEQPEAVRLRTWVIVAFWALIVLVGLPMWWQTTSIYRASLPIVGMLAWSEGKVRDVTLPLQVKLNAPSMPCERVQRLQNITNMVWNQLNHYSAYRLDLGIGECKSTGRRDSTPQKSMMAAWNYSISEQVAAQETLEGIAYGTVQAVQSMFEEEQASITGTIYSMSARSPSAYLNSIPGEVHSRISQRETRAVKASPEYHLTFSLFTPESTPSSWDIEAARQQHINPWVAALSQTSNFSITTQIQLFSAFSEAIQPIKEPENDGTLLRYDDLSAFVNAAEWPVSPSIGAGPTLNFVLYVPAAKQVPMSIQGTGEVSWLIPQWGGISILNPVLRTSSETGRRYIDDHLEASVLAQPFDTFAKQMLSLLGVPSTNLKGGTLPVQVRVQSHTRQSAISLYSRAATTLGSLARLSQSLGSIPIPKHVARLVDETITHLKATCDRLGTGDWNAALREAQLAFETSEKAFFDKSMVGQVYFPDEHKVAVYLPLLGPIGVPLVVGLLRELKQLLKVFRSRR